MFPFVPTTSHEITPPSPQFAQLSETARRSRLRMLTDEEYDNVMRVTWSMPYVDMEVKSEVCTILIFKNSK